MAEPLLTADDVLAEDLRLIADSQAVAWDSLVNRTVLVTGATGYIGSLLVRALLLRGARVLPFVRDVEKARRLFGDLPMVVGDIREPIALDSSIDYIIHAASVTASRVMVEKPYETMVTTLRGTENMLSLAREKAVKGMVFLSSMEVYGTPQVDDIEMSEEKQGYIDPLALRSSYPLSKRMAEGLCAAAAHEYGVPVRIARLAQTFGAGVAKTENRVFAQFARAILTDSDIVLKTDGSKAHCYCYSRDAVIGLLMLLTSGVSGEAYNLSNESTFCSIREMAERLIAAHPGCKTRLVFETCADVSSYPPSSRMKVMSGKMRGLGWKPQVGLEEMFDRLMRSLASPDCD